MYNYQLVTFRLSWNNCTLLWKKQKHQEWCTGESEFYISWRKKKNRDLKLCHSHNSIDRYCLMSLSAYFLSIFSFHSYCFYISEWWWLYCWCWWGYLKKVIQSFHLVFFLIWFLFLLSFSFCFVKFPLRLLNSYCIFCLRAINS